MILGPDVEVNKECLARLEEEMFEVSNRARIAGYYQWGLDSRLSLRLKSKYLPNIVLFPGKKLSNLELKYLVKYSQAKYYGVYLVLLKLWWLLSYQTCHWPSCNHTHHSRTTLTSTSTNHSPPRTHSLTCTHPPLSFTHHSFARRCHSRIVTHHSLIFTHHLLTFTHYHAPTHTTLPFTCAPVNLFWNSPICLCAPRVVRTQNLRTKSSLRLSLPL